MVELSDKWIILGKDLDDTNPVIILYQRWGLTKTTTKIFAAIFTNRPLRKARKTAPDQAASNLNSWRQGTIL